ncbi:MAG: S1C family serine protease [Gemmataceae bacterium]
MIGIIRTTAAVLIVAATASSTLAQSDMPGKKTVTRLFSDIVSKVADSTVRVRVNGKDLYLGTVVDAKGYILTKGDELDGAISVRLRDGSEHDAVYVGYDEGSDLAMLKIDAELSPVSFVDATKAQPGNWVAASGTDSEAVAAGVVSVGSRKLFNEEAFFTGKPRGYLGILLKMNDDEGLYIESVNESSPSRGKLKANDAIIRVNDFTVKGRTDLQGYLSKKKPGEEVTVIVLRGEKELEFKIKLAESPDSRGDMQNKMGSTLSRRRTGFPNVITTDAVVKPTDCGAPLVDLEGNVLGIVIARAGRVESWALPAETIRPLIAKFKAGKIPPPEKK